MSSVGFCRASDGSLLVVLPKAFSNPAAQSRIDHETQFRQEQVFRLIRVFRKILEDKRYAQANIDSTPVRSAHTRSLDPVWDELEAGVRLRADYRRNGLWLSKKRTKALNEHSHPVDWHATMRQCPPLIEGSSVLFLETIHQKRRKDTSNLFYYLHIHTLRSIFEKTGEKHLLNGLPSIDDSVLRPVLKRPLAYLRSFRREIFSDRGRMLLACIEAYLGTRSLKTGRPSLKDDCLSYTSKFENIWECILSQLFSTQAQPKYSLDTGQWVSWPSGTKGEGISPVADLVLKQPTLTILDAKDYRIFNGSPIQDGRIGHAGDHYKQIIYRTLLGQKDNEPIVNILAFPSIGQTSLFSIKGCHFWPTVPASPVFEVCVDYDKAVKHWLGDAKIDVSEQFRVLIEEIKSFERELKKKSSAPFS